ncbi:hypothetical protein JCM10207_008399 [Rhodosporidiobolus poonsookiae]
MPAPTAPLPLSVLEDRLDALLQHYLDTLDQYQSTQAALHSHLKQGYLHLAKSKIALGPLRVSQDSYDLSEKAAQRVVSIAPSSSSLSLATAGGDDAPPSLLSYAVVERPPAPAASSSSSDGEGDSAPASSTLRQRPSATRASSLPSDPAPSPSPKPKPPPTPSPLAQFSPLPPLPLRLAASSFARVAEAAARVVESEGRVREAARGVKRARREVERRRREEEGGEGGS